MFKEKQSRRDFLKKSALATAGMIVLPQIVPASALGRGGKVAPSDRIVMASIGSGSMGCGDMRNLISQGAVQYVAVCDVDASHRQNGMNIINERYGTSDARSYGDFREILEKEDLDAVSVAVPDHWHALITVAAANKGVNIYGQKPLCRYIKEGRAIVNAVNKNDIVFQTGSQQRSDSKFYQAATIVKNGDLGKILRIEVGLPNGNSKGIGMPAEQAVPAGVDWDMWLGPAKKVPFRGILHWDWRWIMDYSGGQLTDWAGHHIDIALWSMGLSHTGPSEIEATGKVVPNDLYDVPYAYDIKTKFADGTNIRIANEGAYGNRKEKLGKNYSIGNNGVVWYGEKGWLAVDRGGICAENPAILEKIYAPKELIYDTMGLNHYQNFVDAVRTGRTNICPVEDGCRSISVALLGEIAMATGEKLKWDPKKELFLNGSEKANALLTPTYRGEWKLKM